MLKYFTLGILFVLTQMVLVNVTRAQEYSCTNSQETRQLKLEYPGRDNLCEVTVTKADKSTKVLWLANSTSVFCSEKIVELVGKYRNQWDYDCSEVASSTRVHSLSPRARTYLDVLVTQIVAQGRTESPTFNLVGVTALGNYSADRENSTMVAQLTIQSDKYNLATDRIYVVGFSPTGHDVKAIHIGLAGMLHTKDLAVTTALVSDVHPDGAFTVSTTLNKVGATAEDTGRLCSGLVVLEAGIDGKLNAYAEHEVKCE